MWEVNRLKDVGPFHVAKNVHEGIVVDTAFHTIVRLARTYTVTSMSPFVLPFHICPCSLSLLVSVMFDRPFK